VQRLALCDGWPCVRGRVHGGRHPTVPDASQVRFVALPALEVRFALYRRNCPANHGRAQTELSRRSPSPTGWHRTAGARSGA